MSLKSMTGFGRARGPVGSVWSAEIVLRSVNHRFLDLTVRAREAEASLEPFLRRVLSRHVARGKVEAGLRIKRLTPARQEVSIDEGLLEAVLSRFAALAQKYPVGGRLEARDLLTIPQILAVEAESNDFSPEELADLESLAEEAARSLVAMRETEGRLIAAELSERLNVLREKVTRLEARRGEITQNIHASLRARLSALVSDLAMDPQRLAQEAALAADRSEVAEEIHRLSGHLEQFRELLEDPREPVGKKLDFLTQEIHRELTTLGSKSRDLQLTREILEMKSEAEKIREQVQNVE